MTNIIKFEMRRLFSSKALYICMGIIALIVVATSYIYSSLPDEGVQTTASNMLLTSVSGASVDIVLAVLIAILICEDFTNGIAKSIIGRGYSRKTVYIAKYIVAIVCACILVMTCWAAAIVSGNILLEAGNDWGLNLLPNLGTQLLIIIVIATASFVFSITIKKNAGAIALGILMPSVVAIILSLADNLLKGTSYKVSDYWIYNYLVKTSETGVEASVLLGAVCSSCIYIFIFGLIGYFLFRKSEV